MAEEHIEMSSEHAGAEAAHEQHGPMEQFTIKPLVPIHVGRLDLSYTNSALFMTFAIALSALLFWGATRARTMVPGRLQSTAELLYSFVQDMVVSNTGKEGMKYFPFIFTLFLFILFSNLLGLLPILRFMWFWIDGHGEGHVQSLIIGGALLVLGVLVAVMGLLADLVAANRKLIEAGLVRLRQIEDGLAVMQTEDVGKRRRPTQKEAA